MRPFDDYTFEGQMALGEAIAYFREAEKPHWKPIKGDASAESGRWTLEKMAEIINREFGLSGDYAVNASALHRMERPSSARMEPPPRYLELIASLEIMLNPKTGKPFSDADLRAIAKGRLNWKTGEKINRKTSGLDGR